MKCKICSRIIEGRADKLFCSLKCKNYYHLNLRRVTDIEVKFIDTILHRNRSILLEIIGKSKHRKTIDRIILEKKQFNFKYHTHINVNNKGKTYFFIYDFAWMEFSNDKILIVRNKST